MIVDLMYTWYSLQLPLESCTWIWKPPNQHYPQKPCAYGVYGQRSLINTLSSQITSEQEAPIQRQTSAKKRPSDSLLTIFSSLHNTDTCVRKRITRRWSLAFFSLGANHTYMLMNAISSNMPNPLMVDTVMFSHPELTTGSPYQV